MSGNPNSPQWVPIVKENAKTVWIKRPDGRVIKVKKERLMGVREVRDGA